jgi:hypothetical protein
MKKFLENKNYGFYVTCGLALLSILTAIVYAVSYKDFYSAGKLVLSWAAFWLLLGWIVVAVVLNVLKLEKYENYVAGLCGLLAFIFFVYKIYYYVSVMAVGIDATFDGKFFFNLILFILVWLGSLANVFFPQVKEAEKAEPVKA